jgi:cytoskeletal protein CcmA (bactofilin family)
VVNLETCGKLIIPRGGQAVAQKRVVALAGIEMDGKLQCRQAVTARHARIGPNAEWKGDLQAASLDVRPGAVIHGGRFDIPSDPFAGLAASSR